MKAVPRVLMQATSLSRRVIGVAPSVAIVHVILVSIQRLSRPCRRIAEDAAAASTSYLCRSTRPVPFVARGSPETNYALRS